MARIGVGTMRLGWTIALLTLGMASPASAQDAMCVERPGLTTGACITKAGTLMSETAIADWTLDHRAGGREDVVLIGDTLLRYGIGHGVELRAEWTPYGIDRDRDADGTTRLTHRVGDAAFGVKAALVSRSGQTGLAVSGIATVDVPVGRRPVGAGDWGAIVLLPISYRFADKIMLQATPVVAARADDDGAGRHAYYGTAVEVEYPMTHKLKADLSAQVARDDDPDPTIRGTSALGSIALAWQPARTIQLDLGTNVGLNRAAPGLEVYAGISHRF